MADYLRQRGFNVVSTGNASSFDNPRTKVTGADKNVAGQVAKQLPVKDVDVETGDVTGGDIEIVIGRDYRAQ